MNYRQIFALAGGFLGAYVLITLTNRPEAKPRPRPSLVAEAASVAATGWPEPDRAPAGSTASSRPIAFTQRACGYALLPAEGKAIDADETLGQMAAMARAGARWVVLRIELVQPLGNSSELPPAADEAERINALRRAIQAAREANLSVMLRPMVRCEDGTHRERISPPQVEAWMASYQRALRPYARMAEEERVALLAVGSNLSGFQGDASWMTLIKALRQDFSGNLTYCASANPAAGFRQVLFWEALDCVGIDAFFPLSNEDHPSLETLEVAWRTVSEDLAAWHKQNGQRPILFTALGCPRLLGAAAAPAALNLDAPDDEALPGLVAEAFFNVVAKQPWLLGALWHAWSGGGKRQAPYTVQGTPTEAVLNKGLRDMAM